MTTTRPTSLVPERMRARLSAARGRGGEAPAVYREHRYLVWVVLCGGIAIVAPLAVTTPPNQYQLDVWLIYAITGIGFYWVFGLAGRFAFCQTFMMAVGGYVADWVTAHLGAGYFLVSLLAAIGASALAALLVGLILMHATMFYFAIGTLAISGIGTIVFEHTTAFSGPNGTVLGVPAPSVFGLDLNGYDQMFWLLLVVLALVVFLGIWLERAPLRRDAIAARDNPLVARTAGVPVVRVQLVLFILGSALGGLAGALLGAVNGNTSTSSFGTQLALGIFLMLLIGGIDSIWGPVVGAGFYVAIQQWLSGLAQYQSVIYGGLLLVVIIVFPQGFVGSARAATARLRGQPPQGPQGTPLVERLRQLLPAPRKGAGDAARR